MEPQIIIKKPDIDTRKYKTITLQNQLQVLMIYDKESSMAGASLDINVGQLQDPYSRKGLAHFCEHMVFLGSKKYPSEDEYREHIRSGGGQCNATTTNHDTVFVFTVSNEKFEKALDYFSNCIIEPLFTESCVGREMKAVNSENDMLVSQDSWRKLLLMKTTAKPKHPYSKFGVGSLETLGGKPGARDDLLVFHEKYYSSNIMTLVILSNHSFKVMEELAIKYFNPIPNKNFKNEIPVNPFGKEELGQVFRMATSQNVKQLQFYWPLQSYQKYYKNKAPNVLSFLFNHQGIHSIFNILKEEGLASFFIADSDYDIRALTEIQIIVELTDQGYKEMDRVIEYVFAYIKMLKGQKSLERVYDEIKAVANKNWTFKQKSNLSAYVQQLAKDAQYYPMEDVLYYEYAFEKYDDDLEKQILSEMTPEKCRLIIISDQDTEQCDQTEPLYNIKYSQKPLPKKWLELMNNPNPKNKISKDTLDLPVQNVYLPVSFKMLQVENMDKPKVIKDFDLSTLYYCSITKFNVPQAMIQCSIFTDEYNFTKVAKTTQLLAIYQQVFNEHFKPIMYLARKAGLMMFFTYGENKVILKLWGYNETIKYFFRDFFESLKSFDPKQYENQFNNKVQMYLQSYENFLKNQPWTISQNVKSVLMTDHGEFMYTELVEIFKSMLFEDFVKFSNSFLSRITMEWLITGNITEQEAGSIVKCAEAGFKSIRSNLEVLPLKKIPALRVVDVPEKVSQIYELQLKKTEQFEQLNSSINKIFFFGKTDFRQQLMMKFLQSFMTVPCFNQLRTQEQLGYTIILKQQVVRHVSNISVIIQSNVQSPQYLSERIDVFLENCYKLLQETDDNAFVQLRGAVELETTSQFINLGQMHKFLSSKIIDKTFDFDCRKKIPKILEGITKEEMIKFYEDIFFKKHKVLEMHIISESHREQNEKLKTKRLEVEGDKCIIFKDAADFKANSKYHPDYLSLI